MSKKPISEEVIRKLIEEIKTSKNKLNRHIITMPNDLVGKKITKVSLEDMVLYFEFNDGTCAWFVAGSSHKDSTVIKMQTSLAPWLKNFAPLEEHIRTTKTEIDRRKQEKRATHIELFQVLQKELFGNRHQGRKRK